MRLVASALVTVAAGLGSRKLGAHLPRFVAEYAGDALYATLIVFLAALVRPRASSWALFAVGFGFSALVEVSQLSNAAPLAALRATTLGRLVLGTTFVASDFPCYAVGAALGASVDALFRLREARVEARAPRPPPPP